MVKKPFHTKILDVKRKTRPHRLSLCQVSRLCATLHLGRFRGPSSMSTTQQGDPTSECRAFAFNLASVLALARPNRGPFCCSVALAASLQRGSAVSDQARVSPARRAMNGLRSPSKSRWSLEPVYLEASAHGVGRAVAFSCAANHAEGAGKPASRASGLCLIGEYRAINMAWDMAWELRRAPCGVSRADQFLWAGEAALEEQCMHCFDCILAQFFATPPPQTRFPGGQ